MAVLKHALALLFFALLAVAIPLQDLSTTSVGLFAENSDHLTVIVTRVDDLLTDEGQFLAERVIAIKMSFDVDNDKILLNGVPLSIGLSSLQVEAAILANTELVKLETEQDLKDLEAQFDVGIVTVEVLTCVNHTVINENIAVRRITVKARVIEVNGETVVQTVAGQQILDVYENGEVRKYIPGKDDALGELLMPGPVITQENPFAQSHQPHHPCKMGHTLKTNTHRGFHWLHCKFLGMRLVLVAIFFTSLFALGILVRRIVLVHRQLRNDGYEIIPKQEVAIEERKFTEAIIVVQVKEEEEEEEEDVVDEKKALIQ